MDEKYPELANWDGYSIDFDEVKPKVDELFNEALEKVSQE